MQIDCNIQNGDTNMANKNDYVHWWLLDEMSDVDDSNSIPKEIAWVQ